MATRTDTLQIRVQVDGSGQATYSLAQVEKGVRNVGSGAKEGTSAIGLLGAAVQGLIGSLSLAQGIRIFVSAIADAQRLKKLLEDNTNSAAEFADAQGVINKLSGESAATVNQLASAYVDLRKNGITPSEQMLRNFANVAAANQKSVQDFAGAVAAALQGQFGALREYGINIKTENGQLVASFEGTRQVIGTTTGDVVDYLQRIGATKYAGAAAAEANTLEGAWERLWKQFTQTIEKLAEFTKAGNGLQSVLDDITRGVDALDSVFGKLDKSIEGVVNKLVDPRLKGVLNIAFSQAFGLRSFGTSAPDFSNVRGGAGPDFSNVIGGSSGMRLVDTNKDIADSTDRVIESLRKQVVAMTAGEAAVIRLTAAEAAAKAPTKEQAQTILALGDALASEVEKKEAAAKSAKELEERLKEETALREVYLEGVRRGNDLIEREERLQRDIANAYRDVIDVLDPYGKNVRDLQDKLTALTDAEEALRKEGLLSATDAKKYEDAINGVKKEIKDAADEADRARATLNLAKLFGDITGQDDKSALSELEGDLNEIAESFTRIIKSGFKDAGSELSSLLDNIATKIVNDIIQNKIVNNIASAAGGGSFSGQQFGQGLAVSGGVLLGSYAGGSGTNAQLGSSIGSALGLLATPLPGGAIWGPIVGGIVGGLLGGLFDDDPVAKIYNNNSNKNVKATGVDAFGRVNIYTHGLGDQAAGQILQATLQVDKAIASLLSPDQISAVKEGLFGFTAKSSSPDKALAERLAKIAEIVEPAWTNFLSQFKDASSYSAAFASLLNLNKALESFDQILATVSGDPMVQLNAQLDSLNQQVTDTSDALNAAIEAQDPTRIEEASSAAIQAVVNRYQTEIQLAQTLDEALKAAQQQAYQLNLTIAQRIAGITGSNANVSAIALGHINDLQASIPGAVPAQGLADLNDFLSTVDTWLQSGSADIQNWLNEQLGALQQQEQELQAWAAAENARMQAAAQAANAAAQAARQRELDALQQQLDLANQWVQVLANAQQLQDSLQTGTSNPLGSYGQLDALNQAIAGILGALPGSGNEDIADLSAEQANNVLQLLQQRLQLIQSSGLYQRPSGGYVDQYNQTLDLIDQIRNLAQPGADEAVDLQQQLVDLQNTAIATYSAGTVDITAKLQAIHDAEDAVREEAQRQQDALNQQALDYYTWAQDQAQQLEDARTQELLDQLNELTGGLPVQDFIALKQNEATELLTDIRDNIRAFLDAVAAAGGGVANAGGGGSSGGNQTNAAGIGTPGTLVAASATAAPVGDVNVQVVINGSGMTQDDVVRTFHREVRNAASDIRRLIQVA